MSGVLRVGVPLFPAKSNQRVDVAWTAVPHASQGGGIVVREGW